MKISVQYPILCKYFKCWVSNWEAVAMSWLAMSPMWGGGSGQCFTSHRDTSFSLRQSSHIDDAFNQNLKIFDWRILDIIHLIPLSTSILPVKTHFKYWWNKSNKLWRIVSVSNNVETVSTIDKGTLLLCWPAWHSYAVIVPGGQPCLTWSVLIQDGFHKAG